MALASLKVESPRIRSIAVLSDVSVGYGTSQVVNLARSLAAATAAPVTLYEPDQPERPPVPHYWDGVDVRRTYTATHPFTASGRTEYCVAVAEQINKWRPDIIVFSSFLAAPVILKLKYKPVAVVYYGLEHTDGKRPKEEILFRAIAHRIDLAVFPEENRAVLDRPRLGLGRTPTLIIYNGALAGNPLPSETRNGKIFYGGLIHPDLTFGNWLIEGPLDKYPVDIYGIIDGYKDAAGVLAGLQKRKARVSYGGYIPSGPDFNEKLRRYSYSLAIWKPSTESTLYAAPNKFFDAIAAGAPPIVAPHPLCVRLVNRYDCGIVIESFTLESLLQALDQAMSIRSTPRYRELVEGCRIAQADLGWDAQFSRFWAQISDIIEKRGVRSEH